MKKHMQGLLLLAIIITSGCSTKKMIIRNNPAFDTQIWLSMKTAVLPVFAGSDLHLKQEKANNTLEPLLLKKSSTFMYCIPSSKVIQEMADKGIMKEYQQLVTSYAKKEAIDRNKIITIGKKLQVDCVFILKIPRDSSTYEKLFNKTGRAKIYSAYLEAEIVDVLSGEVLFQAEAGGTYQDTNPYITLPSLNKLTIVTGYQKEFARAYVNGFEKIISILKNKFIGECREGNCQNGNGTLLFYNKAENKGRFLQKITKYHGEWNDGYAHGKGTMYEEEGDLSIKYDAVWEKGELKTELQLYHLRDNTWIPMNHQDLEKMKEKLKK